MSETDLTIVITVLSLAMSITAIVITLTKKPSKGTVSRTRYRNNKLNELHERVNVLENLLKGELKVTLHEMMGRIDQLNEAVFKQQ